MGWFYCRRIATVEQSDNEGRSGGRREMRNKENRSNCLTKEKQANENKIKINTCEAKTKK
jgi:hypothetical protein